jgi:hypothetical protein
MKKFLLKPGFEFIFSLSLIVILGLPPVLLAQNQKGMEIKIENGDTIINGRNIKELSAKDRQSALRDINNIKSEPVISPDGRKDGKHRTVTTTIVVKDSLGNIVDVKPLMRPGADSKFALSYRMHDGSPDKMLFEGRGFSPPLMRFDRRNSQWFDYVNTDNDGISTHVSFRVGDASNDDLKKISAVQGSKFEIKDMNLVPQFTTGKTLLMFTLPAKSAAEVKLTDTEGKLIWSEKAIGGSFTKSFVLGLNGIYYLQVKQGSGVAIKKIVKEE